MFNEFDNDRLGQLPEIEAWRENTKPGEVVYADDSRILTRKWNYRDCDHCKITDQSQNIALFTEAPFDAVATGVLADSIGKMAELIVKYCGGEARTVLLDVSKELEADLP
jgi:DNA/RNA-binding domain of Phe-tRNA-synthetase-like protein